MKTTYRKIAEIQDVFRKLSEMPLTVLDAESLKQGIIELDKFYGKIDIYKKELIKTNTVSVDKDKVKFKNEKAQSDYEEELNKFLDQEIELEFFPLTIRHGNSIRVTALDLIRIEGMINFLG